MSMEGAMRRKRRCMYEGCRGWARKTSGWCVAHPEGKPRQVGGAPAGNQNARTHGLYAHYVPIVALERALDLPPGDLRLEIAVTRAVLAELLHTGLPAEELIKVLEKGSATLSRLLRTNKYLDSGAAEQFDDALACVLEKMNVRVTSDGTSAED